MHALDIPQALPPGNWWLQALPASIAAGFPSPAEDHQVERIDLMQQLVKHPQATFYIRVRGESMRDVGILDGSVVLVDRAITPADGQIVLAGRAQVGAVLGSSLANTPRGFLFYTGGGGSVRGLPYQSLGVTSAVGPSGGRSFAALSGEVRVRVNDSMTLAAFADAGQVSAGVFNGASDWQAGGGFGIRYATPIGPLRLDLATPLRRNATALGSSTYQIYLGIGQSF